jgi:hypothetical protein
LPIRRRKEIIMSFQEIAMNAVVRYVDGEAPVGGEGLRSLVVEEIRKSGISSWYLGDVLSIASAIVREL